MDKRSFSVVKPKHNRTQNNLRATALAAVFLVWAPGSWAQQAGGTTFQNTNSIVIPAAGPAFPIPAAPYPSVIAVSNLSGQITSVTLNLIQFTHSSPDTVDIMLAGPGGQKVLLMSDAGGVDPVGGLILNFADSSTGFLPDSTRIFSGSFRPSNYETGPDVFPTPAPSGALNSSFSVFDGTNPNGLWRLYAVGDSSSPNGGSISGGWQLSITTASPPAIIKQPQDQTVSPGSTAQFVVEVSGTPPFAYQWLRNGQVLVPFGQGTDTLRIPNIGPQHAGLYSVVVLGSATQSVVQSRLASLFVRGPIQVPPPDDQIVLPDTDVTFYAAPSGDPPFRFQWRRNGIWLPGETNSTLRRLRVRATDGGHYSYIAQSGGGARTSEPGLLKVLEANGPPPADDFRLRPVLTTDHGILQGTSEKATFEPGEPLAIGGGKTMWIEWRPAKTGIVRFTMLGSAFDTILTVFPQNANGSIDISRVITRDEDRAGFYTSQFDFNAQAGQSYFVQLDGFGIGGDGGEFTLKWDLEPSNARTPVIVTNPVPQSVAPGDKVTFSAVVEPNPAGLPPQTFQWFFNGIPLSNETSPTLTIPSAQSRNVGFYSLRVSNGFGIAVFSPPVVLQLGLPAGYLMEDKLEMLYLRTPSRSGFQSGNPGGFLMQEKGEMFQAMSGSGSAGEFKPIGFGGMAFDEGPWPAQAGPKDPNPCDSPLSGTLWQGLSPTNTGLVQVSTAGSGVGTRMAIYRLTGTPADLFGGNPPLVCDVTSVSNGVPCVATFNATNGSNYTVVVEGYFADAGLVQITSVMGTAPPPTNTLKYCLVFLGGSIQLSMPATNWFPAPQCQWYHNGSPITDATNATLEVTDFSLSDIGTYSVRMSNFVGTNTCDVAYLDDAPPFELHYSWVSTAGGTGYKITASNAAPFVLETTVDLAGSWTPIATNPDPCLVLYYTNGPPTIGPQRFYRAVPWSPGP